MYALLTPPPAPSAQCTWCQQDDGGDDQRADDQNDKKGDRYSLPVPLRRVTAHQLLWGQTERRETPSETRTDTTGKNQRRVPANKQTKEWGKRRSMNGKLMNRNIQVSVKGERESECQRRSEGERGESLMSQTSADISRKRMWQIKMELTTTCSVSRTLGDRRDGCQQPWGFSTNTWPYRCLTEETEY